MARYRTADIPATVIAAMMGISSQVHDVMLPVVHDRTCCEELGSATSMRNCWMALRTNIREVPARIIMTGDGLLNRESTRIMPAGTSPKTNALTTTPALPGMMNTPRVIATVAPKAAPEDMPVVYGSARGFFSMLCIAAPATASPAPDMTAARMRGRRWFHTTDAATVSSTHPGSMPVSASHVLCSRIA